MVGGQVVGVRAGDDLLTSGERVRQKRVILVLRMRGLDFCSSGWLWANVLTGERRKLNNRSELPGRWAKSKVIHQ